MSKTPSKSPPAEPPFPVGRDALEPMLCTTGGPEVLDAPGWSYELKLDGVRLVVRRDGDKIALFHRKIRERTRAYPDVVGALRALPAPPASVGARYVLDGEVVAFDDAGRPSFQRLGRRLHVDGDRDVAAAMRETPVVYVVFDVLAAGDRDVRPLPLAARREVLASIVPPRGLVSVLGAHEAGRALYETCVARRLEGLVAKRLDAPYASGVRSPAWIKVKADRDDEFVVVGFTRGAGGRARLGALEVASFDERGELWTRGRVGSGLDERTIDDLVRAFAGTTRATSAAHPLPPMLRLEKKEVTYVAPMHVVSVRYGGWTEEGALRHAVFRGVRADVDPPSCRAAPSDDAPHDDG